MFAFLGTFVSAFSVGGLLYAFASGSGNSPLSFIECLAFGSLISATDPVSVLGIMKDISADSKLYNLIFGESIFNDAVAIVLYQTVLRVHENGESAGEILGSVGLFFLIFLGSCFIGNFTGMLISYILKTVQLKQKLNFEVSTVIFGPWISYLLSEALHLSGIVSILFCGIAMARYTYPNLSEISRLSVGKAYSAVAEAFEVLVFIFLGMGLFSFSLPYSKMGAGLFLMACFFILLVRAFMVPLFSALLNPWRKRKLTCKHQFFMWFAGFRGAIAFALAIQADNDFENGDLILAITLLFAIISVVGGGSLVTPLLYKLNLIERQSEPFARNQPPSPTRQTPCSRIKKFVLFLDETYIYPLLVRRDFSVETKSPEEPVFENEIELGVPGEENSKEQE